jgi:mono/diheme cytochrome c family protein
VRRIFETSVFCAILATACSTAITPQEGLKPRRSPSPTATAAAQGQKDGANATQIGSQGNSSTSNSANSSSSVNNTTVAAFTLDEAKARCASCHQPGGSGSSVWNNANGTEADWKAFANSAKMSVNADRMPPPNGLAGQDKTKMIAFLDKLLGISSGSGSTTPQPIVFNFDSARALCIGCHAKGGSSPRLERLTQWTNNKGEIRSEVKNGSMPRKKTLTSEERTALLKYINSL